MNDSILRTIGGTPLVALDRMRKARGVGPRVFAKVEYFNPGGSIKDRAALMMVDGAERSGRLKRGQEVVELTSGNMGIGLAVVTAVKGYRFTAVMSRGNSPERWRILRALGAKVVLVPQAEGGRQGQVSKEDLELVERMTRRIVERTGAFRPDQFNNPDNPRAHEEGTGTEIWDQLKGNVTHFVALVGTGGTFVGVSRALRSRATGVKCYAVEPARAPVLAGRTVKSTKHKLQGTGYAFVPPLWSPGLCDGYLTATDEEAIRTARELATTEGVLGGFSGGANVAAAFALARKVEEDASIVTVVPDTGLRYLSTDLFR